MRPGGGFRTLFSDSLRIASSGTGVRVFGVRDTNDVVLWARSGTLAANQAFDAPVAVRQTRNGGRLIVSTIPALAAGGPVGGRNFIDKVFLYLGIKP